MKKSVQKYISELLFLHDCVILPGFGGFVGNKRPAELNRETGTFTPSSKQILFNKNLTTNDGLLISHIAYQEEILNEEAQELVNTFSNEVNNQLNNSKILRIEKIGLFTLGKENNVVFIQDRSINYNLDSFGMTATYNNAVERKNEIEKEVVETIYTIKTNSKQLQVMLRAAAIILPLFTLSYLSIYQQDRINSVYTQMANLNPFPPMVVNEDIPAIKNESKVKNIHKTEAETSIFEEEKIISNLLEKKKYYIIAGAFAKQKNIDKMILQLTKWGYNPEIVEGGKLLRVSYYSFTKRENAVVALNIIKQANRIELASQDLQAQVKAQ